MAYSTIRQKVGKCDCCGKEGPLAKKMCSVCYWTEIKLKSVNKQNERESSRIIKEEDLGDLIADLDKLVSRYVRISSSNKEGLVQCFTCPTIDHYSKMDAGHFIGRACMFLRFDTARNIRVQCIPCNRSKYGRPMVFSSNLEKELPDVSEILIEESRLIHHWSRHELKAMINEFQDKLKQLQK